jgi:hypothetical protein
MQSGISLKEQPVQISGPLLSQRIVRDVEGWAVSDEPLGLTEAATESALNLLNLDDFVYRRYQRGSVYFTIYVAHWVSGKMPTRLVAIHTPDRCWTENGMQCVELRFSQTYLVRDRKLLPAEWRVFVPRQDLDEEKGWGRSSTAAMQGSSGPRVHVVYWHLVAGKLYDYGRRFNAVPDPWRWWKDTLEQAAYGSQEQFFIRVASETPIELLFSDPGFQRVLESVANLGLYAGEGR